MKDDVCGSQMQGLVMRSLRLAWCCFRLGLFFFFLVGFVVIGTYTHGEQSSIDSNVPLFFMNGDHKRPNSTDQTPAEAYIRMRREGEVQEP